MTAEECRVSGNAAYIAKRFDEALGWYTKATEIEPTNAVLHNNRAAALMELKRYAEAAASAEKSAILVPTAKANGRHARALWNLGKLKDATEAYQRALKLEPTNAEYKEALAQLTTSQPSQRPSYSPSGSSGSDPLAMRAFQLDAAIILGAVFAIIGMFLFPAWSVRAWQLALVAMIGRQVFALSRTEAITSFAFWKNYATVRGSAEFAGQYIFVSLGLLVMSSPVQPMLLFAMAVYAAVDAAVNHNQLIQTVLPPRLLAMFGDRIATVRANRDQLLAQAAACEAFTLFMTPVSGAGLAGTLAIVLFVKWRYQSDNWSKMAWRGMHEQFRGYAFHPRCPGIVGTLFTKLAALLHRAAM